VATARKGLSRRALMGAAAAVTVASSAAFTLGGKYTALIRRSRSDNKTLNRGNGAEPDTLDPQKIQSDWENNIVGDMFMGLMTEDAAANPVPGAAESFTKSTDGLTYTFKIRAHKWSDGVPVTADDFVFSFQRILDPKTAAQYASLLYAIKNAQAVNGGKLPPAALGVRAIDASTFEMKFEYEVPYLPQLLTHYTMMPVPKHVIEKHGTSWLQPRNIATNGGYTLKEWIPNDRITLVKNSHFYDAANVKIETVNFYPTQDYAAALKRFRAGEFDMANGVPSSEIGWLRTQMPHVLHLSPFILTQYVQFNVTKKPFDDKRVREAISMVIDREIIARRVMNAGEQPAYAMVPPHMPNYSGKAQANFRGTPMATRIAGAKKLLEDAGYGPGNPLAFEYAYQTQTDARLIAVALQSMWKQIGAVVDLVPADPQVHYAAMRRQDFMAAWAGWIADYRDAKDYLFLAQTSSKEMNFGRYSNPKFDSLVAQSDMTGDLSARDAMLGQAEQILLDDVAFAPVFYGVSRAIISEQVKNWIDNGVNINRTRYLWVDRGIASA
jgi:oligopeptide transport system substrate-binding protein